MIVKKLLDFHGLASGTVGMDDTTREQLNFVFAKLTGSLEDAASQALRGQRSEVSPEEAMELVQSLQVLLHHAAARMRAIELLARQSG